jgi:hypothetical protein
MVSVRSQSSASVSSDQPPADRTASRRHAAHAQRLQRSQQVAAIADLDVRGDGADPRIAEVTGQGGHRVGLDERVGVEGHHHLAARGREPGVEGRGLAAVGLVEDA